MTKLQHSETSGKINPSYTGGMNTVDKNTLAMTGHSDVVSTAIRMKAARLAAGMSQDNLANAMGQRTSSISNIERARNFPGWPILIYFFEQHRIDLNFLVTGAYSQLPGDIQDLVFSQLVNVHAGSTLLEDSGPRQTAMRLQEA